MKKYVFTLVLLCIVSGIYAQDISKSQVPSIILNQFNNQFPKASDVEWEMEGIFYKVDFEIGWNNEHEVWYNSFAKMVKHKEELSKKNLPNAIKITLQNNYRGYRVDDVAKFTEGKKVTYKVEIEKGREEKIIFFNENGTLTN